MINLVQLIWSDGMQRYFAKDYKDNRIVLETSDVHHIKNVMRMKVNDLIEVIYNNTLYICKIFSFDPFSLNIEKVIEENNNISLDVTIAVGLVKEQKMDLILQKLTELGVNRIIPVDMERSIVKIDNDRFKKKKERWISICKEASEQSKRTSIPIIEDVTSLKDLIETEADVKLVASTKEKDKLFNFYLQEIDKCAKIIIVIGPEGGLSDKEESYLLDNGFSGVSFGNLVFRVETACIYVASIFNYFGSMR